MPAGIDPRSPFAALWANIDVDTHEERQKLADLESMLLRSSVGEDVSNIVARELSVERADRYSPSALPNEQLVALEDFPERTGGTAVPEFRVFRRETPAAA